MKICMLSELFYPYMLGGAERRYYEIGKRLAKKHDVTVYSLRLRGQKSEELIENIKIKRVGLSHLPDRRSFLPLVSYFPAILKAFSSDFDIIDANQGVASFAGLINPAKPLVATFHDIYWNKWGEHFSFPYSCLGKSMEFLWSKAKYSYIIANSPETKNKLESLGFSHPIETIISGVDMDFIKKTKAKKENNVIVYVGRLEKYKGVDSLLQAVAEVKNEVKDVKLKIVGSGSEEKNLRKLAKDIGINVEFFGFVNEEEKIKILKSSDVIVNPSHIEGLGLIALEAMACDVPVIVRNLRCYFFCTEENSLRYTNDEDLTKLLLKLLQEPSLGKRLSKNGLVTAGKFSWDETARRVEDIYKISLAL